LRRWGTKHRADWRSMIIFGAALASLPIQTQGELEAESVSYIVCERNGVESAAQVYLNGYLEFHTKIEDVDILAIRKAAGR
jgi:hypothetical protein